jgi:thiol:disulfide interchange protein DsbD
MRRSKWLAGLVLLLLLHCPVVQAAHTRARLLLADEQAKPGSTVLAGIELRMEPGWHTYWKNSGDSGSATEVKWQLPPSVKAGPLQWPLPRKLMESTNLTTYVYDDRVVLLVPLTVSQNVSPGPLQLKAGLTWLECKTSCIPGEQDVEASLTIGSENKPSKDAELLRAWQEKMPKSGDKLNVSASWEPGGNENSRKVLIQWSSTAKDADFLPDTGESYEVQSPTERVAADPGAVRVRKEVKKSTGDWPKSLPGVLVEGSGKDQVGYAVNLLLSGSAGSSTPSGRARAGSPASSSFGISLPLVLLYAFLGGLLLNVMPCVLPVIALKILGFVKQAKDSPREVRKLSLIYTLGVLVSFLVLALLVLGIRAAGKSVGWGFQFANPYFLVLMTVLVTLIALNLMGVFEITLGGKTIGAAANLSSKHGATGAFFNGLLATVLATSCSAPVLGTAVGFAFAQTPLVIVLVMLTVGLGLAAPYLVLSSHPAYLRFLPKPGPWMEKFRVAMGFPMLGAAVWLCSLLTIHYGERAWWMAVFLVFLALAAWVFGTFVQRGMRGRGLATILSLALLLAGYAYAIEGGLHWREPLAETAIEPTAKETPRGIAWEKWSREAVAQARSAGHPVIVDFTAKWCPTCNTIVKPTLESHAVQQKLQEINAVALLANYTRQPQEITDELRSRGRAGVPLVLVYPRDPAAEPMVFDLVTPGALLDALDRAK